MNSAKYLLLLASTSCVMGQRNDIASTTQPLPDDASITFGDFSVIDANGDGNFMFVSVTGDREIFDNEFLFVSDAEGNLTRAITEGQAAPTGQGTLGNLSLVNDLAPILGQNGTVAIVNFLQGTADARVVLAWDASSGIRQVARQGLNFPDGSGDEFENFFRQVSVAETGSVTVTATSDQEVIFQERANNALTTIRPFDLFGGDDLNQTRFVDATDSGEIVMGSQYRDSIGLTTGIFAIVSGNTVTDRALRGDNAPGPSSVNSAFDGTFDDIETEFSLNSSNSIAFFSSVEDDRNFGNGVFFQEANNTLVRGVVRERQPLSGGALGNRQATFVGTGAGITTPDTTFLLTDNGVVFISGPLTINGETARRSSLLRWTLEDGIEVILVGDDTLPDANPVVTLDTVILQDVSANGAVSIKARASNNSDYPYHYHPDTGLTLLANLGESLPTGTIITPAILGPELDDNGDAIFTFLVTMDNVNRRVLSLFDAGITPELDSLPTPCITVTTDSSEVTLSEIPDNLSLQLQIREETTNEFVDFGSPVLSEDSSVTLPGPDPATVPNALLRVTISE